MATACMDSAELTPVETLVIGILRREGTLTFETLSQRAGLDWSQVFMAVDHLSRSGDIRLQRGEGRQYRLRLNSERT